MSDEKTPWEKAAQENQKLKAENERLSKELNASPLMNRLRELQVNCDRLLAKNYRLRDNLEELSLCYSRSVDPGEHQEIVIERDRLAAQVAQLLEVLGEIQNESFREFTRGGQSKVFNLAKNAREAIIAPAVIPANELVVKSDVMDRVVAVCADGQRFIPESDVESLVKALDKIASWSEGDNVKGSFDEPVSACEARKVLNVYRAKHPKPRTDEHGETKA